MNILGLIPSEKTLKKYGINDKFFGWLIREQNFKCPICEREFSSERKPVIDHEHVKGFKKMPSHERSSYVRGLLCAYCNLRRIPKSINLIIASNIVRYLTKYNSKPKSHENTEPKPTKKPVRRRTSNSQRTSRSAKRIRPAVQ